MSRFQQINQPQEGSELHSLYQDILSHKLGDTHPLNWFTSQSERPDLLAANWDLTKGILLNGQLPAAIKQMIVVVISLQNNCRYCTDLYTTNLVTLGISEEVIKCITADFNLEKISPSQRAILKFALKASEKQQGLTDQDFQELFDFGMSNGEIIEVLMVTAYANLINYWADISGLRPETESN